MGFKISKSLIDGGQCELEAGFLMKESELEGDELGLDSDDLRRAGEHTPAASSDISRLFPKPNEQQGTETATHQEAVNQCKALS